MADIWTVPDGSQQAFLEALSELFELLRRSPGFIQAQTFRSVNPTKILSYARYESPAAQQEAQNGPGVARMQQRLRDIAHHDLHRYTLAETFLPPD